MMGRTPSCTQRKFRMLKVGGEQRPANFQFFEGCGQVVRWKSSDVRHFWRLAECRFEGNQPSTSLFKPSRTICQFCSECIFSSSEAFLSCVMVTSVLPSRSCTT